MIFSCSSSYFCFVIQAKSGVMLFRNRCADIQGTSKPSIMLLSIQGFCVLSFPLFHLLSNTICFNFLKSYDLRLWKPKEKYIMHTEFYNISLSFSRLTNTQGPEIHVWNVYPVVFISHASKVMLKILKARLQQYVNGELPDVQAGFRKGKGTRDQIANIVLIIEKAKEFKNS